MRTALSRRGAGARDSQRSTKRASAAAASSKDASRLSRSLAGDLDNIVLMALRKEPARRYSTVAGLSDDVRRYLERLPVAARADTFGYQFGKFVQRNMAMVGGVAVLFVALLGASIVSTGMYFRADAARQAAQQAESEAESQRARANRVVVRQQAVKLFLTQVLGDLNTRDDTAPPPSVLQTTRERSAMHYDLSPARNAIALPA